MEWYIPITILPGVCMLILSTTGQMMALSTEIDNLLSNHCNALQNRISDLKIKQLNRLTKSAALLYISAACFVLSGVLGAILPMDFYYNIPNLVLFFGVCLVLVALGILINYGVHTINIRQLQHQHNHDQWMEE